MKSNTEKAAEKICINCTHFHNTPEYIESVFKGMTSLGSGHGSVRKDDGICELNEEYLSADCWCDKFEKAK